jgi:hypothetical protein
MRTKPPHTSLSATLSLIVLVSILPRINSCPVSYDNHDMATENLTIPRATILLLIIGFVGIALSPHIVVLALAIMVYTLGAGYSGAIRCLVNPPGSSATRSAAPGPSFSCSIRPARRSLTQPSLRCSIEDWPWEGCGAVYRPSSLRCCLAC